MAKIFQSLDDTELVALLRSGAVGVIPTDTIYGLVASALNLASVARLYSLKHRERKPGTIIAATIGQLAELGVEQQYLNRAKALWPGPVSIETPHDIRYLHQGTGRQAFRIPSDPDIHALLMKTGPLQTTSANLPDETPATNYTEAKAYFGDTVDFYVDGPVLRDRPPSTIVRFSNTGQLEIIREGAVHITKDGQLG